MAREGLKYTISAVDRSSSVLRGTLGTLNTFRSKATSLVTAPFRAITSLRGLGLQANINLITNVVGKLDTFIDRGARMDATQRSFIALTGRSEQAAMRLARRLQDQSNGALTLARSMELANRGLSSGMNAGDIGTTFDFISKKAITTGTNIETALSKVMTGLIRGSTLFLDDYGVLVDGVEQVRRGYDAINGKKAFDHLTPAAQKAEIVRAAIVDMNRQMATFGVTGRESAFQWARIKSSIRGAFDYLSAAAVKSDWMRGILTDVSTLATNIARGLEVDPDKTFKMLSDNARNLIGTVMMDTGRLLISGAIEYVPKLFRALFEGAKRFVSYLGELLQATAVKAIGQLGLLLKDHPLVGRFIDAGAAKKAADTPLPGSPVVADIIEGLKPKPGQPAFEGTLKAWRKGVDAFDREMPGKTDMEKQADRAKKMRTSSEKSRISREMIPVGRQLKAYERWAKEGKPHYSADELQRSRSIFNQEQKEMPELGRLSGKQKQDRLGAIRAEERAATIKTKQTRYDELKRELAEATAAADAAGQPEAARAVANKDPWPGDLLDRPAWAGREPSVVMPSAAANQDRPSPDNPSVIRTLVDVFGKNGVPTSQPATTQPAPTSQPAQEPGMFSVAWEYPGVFLRLFAGEYLTGHPDLFFGSPGKTRDNSGKPATTQPAAGIGAVESEKSKFWDEAWGPVDDWLGKLLHDSLLDPGKPSAMINFLDKFSGSRDDQLGGVIYDTVFDAAPPQEMNPPGGADAGGPRDNRTNQAIDRSAVLVGESAEHLRAMSDTLLASAQAGRRGMKELSQLVGMI